MATAPGTDSSAALAAAVGLLGGVAGLSAMKDLVLPFLYEEERCRLYMTTARLLDRERLVESRAHWESLVRHLSDKAAEEA